MDRATLIEWHLVTLLECNLATLNSICRSASRCHKLHLMSSCAIKQMNIYSYIEHSRLRTVDVIQQIVYKDEEQDRTQDGSL